MGMKFHGLQISQGPNFAPENFGWVFPEPIGNKLWNKEMALKDAEGFWKTNSVPENYVEILSDKICPPKYIKGDIPCYFF